MTQNHNLSIIHLNTHDIAGGAAKVAWRLAEAQRQAGHASKMLVGHKTSNSSYSATFPIEADDTITAKCHKEGRLFYEFQGSHRLVNHPAIQSADILHLHNLHGDYFNPFSISALSHAKPVIWTLHDMQSITGHCAHSFECGKWQTGCGDCPYLDTEPALPIDTTVQLWRDKQLIYDHSYLQIVTPSLWLKNKVEQSMLKAHPVELIYNGVDTNIFRPYPREEMRRKFGLPENAFILGAVAHGGALANQWKGGRYTQAVLKALQLENPDFIFVNIGAGGRSDNPRIINIPHLIHENELAQAYSALDVFLYTPVADNCPLVVIEALACGVPLITFSLGGIPELARDGLEGLVTSFGDVSALIQSTRCLATAPDLREKLSHSARDRAITKFDHKLVAGQYEKLYREMAEAFENRTSEAKIFSLSIVPEIILTNDFLAAETIKLNTDKLKDDQLKNHTSNEFVPVSSSSSADGTIVDRFSEFTYSKKSHFKLFRGSDFPKISIITPSFNQVQYLEACIDSILSQNYPNLEYIIMDGGSTDGSVEIIKKYEKYLAYWQSQPDGGQYQAINAGFKRSTGEIMGWLNSDDKLHSQSLFKVAYIFSTHFEVDWIEGLMTVWNKTGQLEWIEPSPKQWSRQDYLRHDYRWIQQESTFWRRSLWDKAGSGLDTSYKLAADLELWARFFRHGQLYRVIDVLGGFRRHGNQRSVLMIDQYVQEAECIIDRENALFRADNEKTLLPGPQPLTLNQDKFKQFVAKTTLSKAIQPLSDKANPPLALPKATSNYLVSAIVSTYNSERFIQGRLQNLVEQSLYQQGQLEIIVIDSNSPQQEGQIVQKFAAKYPYIKYHRTPKRETVYAAWNRGIKLAEGRYIINANTDDRFAPDALERMAAELAQQVDLHAVYGDWLVTQTENDSFESPTNKFVFNYPNFYPPLLFYYQITSHAAMFRRDTFNLIGYFDGNFKVFGDRDLMFRFAIAGLKAKKLPVIVGLYLENPSSLERASGTAIEEFSLIRNRFRNSENLARLFGYEIVPDPTTVAQLFAISGSLGKDFYSWNGKKVSDLSFAMQLLSQALELDPNNILALNNLAIINCIGGHRQKTRRLLERVFSQQLPNSPYKSLIKKNLGLLNNEALSLTELSWIYPQITALDTESGNQPPLVSVIIPTYNRPKMLIQAIRSVLNQTYENTEIIVINDAGVDVSSEISALNTHNNINYIKLDKHIERSAARNIGIRAARGKYIAYLDDDDIYYPTHLEKLITFLETTDYKVVYSDAYRAYQEKFSEGYVTTHRDSPGGFDFDYDLILIRNFVQILCFVHEKSCFNVGLFDETLTRYEDWDLWIRLSRKYQIAHLKETTCEFTWRQDGTSSQSNLKIQFLDALVVIYRKYQDYVKNRPALIQAQQENLFQELRISVVDLINREAWPRAQEYLSIFIDAYPTFTDGYRALSEFLRVNGQPEKAEQILALLSNNLDKEGPQSSIQEPVFYSSPNSNVPRVLLLYRSDVDTQGGAATVIRETGRALEKIGVQVDISYEMHPDTAKYDIVHVFNIWHPKTALKQLEYLKQQNIPVVWSPIYLNWTEYTWMNLAIRFVFDPKHTAQEKRKLLCGLAEGTLEVNGLNRWYPNEVYPGFHLDINNMLNHVDYICFTSYHEVQSMTQIAPWTSIPFSITPHGVDIQWIESASPDLFLESFHLRDFILCVGAIEPRKNQLMLIEALKDTGLKIVLIGPNYEADYLARCKEVGRSNLLVTGRLPKDLVASAYKAAAVHVLPSFAEGAALANLEAAVAACPMVVSNRSSEFEYFGDAPYYCNPNDLVSVREAVLRAYHNCPAEVDRWQALSQLVTQTYTWEQTARKTLQAYQAVLERISSSAQASLPESVIPPDPVATIALLTPSSPSKTHQMPILWHAPIYDPSGYADEARNFILQLRAQQVNIAARSIGRHSTTFRSQLTPESQTALDQALAHQPDHNYISLIHFPAYAFQRLDQAAYNIGRVMFETDGLPADWVAKCNQMDEIWVPTEFNLQTFRNAGVTAKLVKIPGGIDTDRFRPGLEPLPIPGARGQIFLSIFEWGYRKGWDVLLRAWAKAFRPSDDVCLVLRTYPINQTDGFDAQAEIEQRINHFLKRKLKLSRQKVAPIIVLGEQVSEQDLPHLHAAATAYVSCSRGEGWGRPQMQAMACGLPVIATRWGGNLEFMTETNSLLLDVETLVKIDERAEIPFYRGQCWAEPSVKHLVTLLRRIYDNPTQAATIGRQARQDMVEKWQWSSVAAIAAERLQVIRADLAPKPTKHGPTARPITLRWEGSQFVIHSLALINREICLRLAQDNQFDLTIIPYEPHQFGPEVDPRFKQIEKNLNRSLSHPADVHIRHQWPPDLSPPAEGHWVMIQPWEFGSLPKEWIAVMREKVDEVWAYTNYVRNCYIQSGLPEDRVFVVPPGVNTVIFRPDAPALPLKTKKQFKFLFVGGTIARKGIDILLDAYAHTFTAADDVCLVIKDMGGQSFYQGRTAQEMIAKIQRTPGAPEIEYIDRTLNDAELAGLYTACDCLAHPYRGEGFGLPIAEAMAAGLPVIVTGYGAALDFCHAGNAYLIPAHPVQLPEKRIGERETVDYPWWAEPDVEVLKLLLRRVFAQPREAKAKGQKGMAYIRTNFTWDHAANVVKERLKILSHKSIQSLARPVTTKPQSQNGTFITQTTTEHSGGIMANNNILNNMIEAMQRAGQWPQAIQLLQEAVKYTQPGSEASALWNSLGVSYFQIGQLSEAETAFGQGLNIDPENLDLLHNLAELYLQQEIYDRATEYLNRALRVNPDDVNILLSLGQCAIMLGTFDVASLAYRRVKALAPDTAGIDQIIKEIEVGDQFNGYPANGYHSTQTDGSNIEETVNQVLTAGQTALEQGDLGQAAKEFAWVVAQYPDLAAAHMALGTTLMAMGHNEAAAASLHRVTVLLPQLATGHNQLGIAQYRLGQLTRAEAAFQQANQVDPSDLEPLLNLIDLYRSQQRYEEAVTAVKEALTLDSNHPDVLIAFGLLSLERGDTEGAEMAWQRLPQSTANHPGALALGQALGYSQPGTNPITQIITQVETAQLKGEWLEGVAMLQSFMKQNQRLSITDRALILNRLGYCRFMAGQLIEAEAVFKQGLEIAPDHLDLLNNLADLYAQQEQFDQATTYLNHALTIAPTDIQLLLSLGQCAIQLEVYDVALLAFQRVQSLAPETEGISEVVEQLQSIEADIVVV